ncbi:hypothetical protein CGI99_03450 [Vibrio parahaemolyticus]|nr:hypothetical protein CGI99_03450 [Vibrio parahaemolyticus]
MQKAAVAQASITKGFEREEPWYDHGDFTVPFASGLAAMWFMIVLMDCRKPFCYGRFCGVCGKCVGVYVHR